MILLIWLVAPFAEAGVIIGLAIANGRHKKRIQELTCQLERQRLYGFEREKTRAGEMPPDPPKPETLSDGWLVPASIVKASWGQTGKTIVVPQEYPNTVHIINRNKALNRPLNRILSRILNCTLNQPLNRTIPSESAKHNPASIKEPRP